MNSSHALRKSLSYRPDIDGLRAIAVLSVVLYHAELVLPGIHIAAGGYLGVDIFFVISGYLISSIIITGIAAGKFTVTGFYTRRIRRIFPALILVLLTCLLVGWFVLLADEFAELGKHVAGGAAFISNIVFWSESGYWDTAADSKPLLHLWSLGVEEQFYIFLPLLLLVLIKYFRRYLIHCLFVLAFVSLLIAEFTSRSDPSLSFYMLHTRGWELLSGAFLASALRAGKHPGASRMADIAPYLSLLILLLSISLFDEATPHPSLVTTIPVIATMALIWYFRESHPVYRLLSSPAVVFVGLISYPLYLWHWPLLVFPRILGGDLPPVTWRIVLMVIAGLLAWLTYRFLERPIRSSRHSQVLAPLLIACMTLAGVMGLVTHLSAGFPHRQAEQLNPMASTGEDGGSGEYSTYGCGLDDRETSKLFGNCKQDVRGPRRFVLIGDSKARALYPGLVRTSTENGRWIFIGGHSPHGAPLGVISDDPLYAKYQKLTNIVINSITRNSEIEVVAITSSTRALFQLKTDKHIRNLPQSPHYQLARDGLQRAVSRLVIAGKQVVLVMDNPTLPYPKDCMSRKTGLDTLNRLLPAQDHKDCHLTVERHLELSAQYRELIKEIAAMFPEKVVVFDTLQYLCDLEQGVCPPRRKGRLLYGITDHVSDYGAGLLGRELNGLVAERSPRR